MASAVPLTTAQQQTPAQSTDQVPVSGNGSRNVSAKGHEVIVNLIANTTTRAGLKIRAELDRGAYPTGIKITDAELATLNLKQDNFHGDWNYTVLQARKKT